MNAIVIVFVPGSDGQLVTDQGATRPVLDTPQQSTESDNTRAGSRETLARDQMTPPLWTWFIENPRRCGA